MSEFWESALWATYARTRAHNVFALNCPLLGILCSTNTDALRAVRLCTRNAAVFSLALPGKRTSFWMFRCAHEEARSFALLTAWSARLEWIILCYGPTLETLACGLRLACVQFVVCGCKHVPFIKRLMCLSLVVQPKHTPRSRLGTSLPSTETSSCSSWNPTT